MRPRPDESSPVLCVVAARGTTPAGVPAQGGRSVSRREHAYDGGAHWWKGAVVEVVVRAANPLEASMRRQRLTISDLMVATDWKTSAASRTGKIAFPVRSPDHTETDEQSGAPETQIPG